ncbi:MAG TPA: VWA domain-containing protein [Pantanalinema sp.]
MPSWDQPLFLWGLVLVLPMALAVAGMVRALRLRRDRYADPDLMIEMRVGASLASPMARLSMLILAFSLLVVALAGPRIGGRLGARLPGEMPALAIAVDVSKSMGVQDLGRDRMGVARDALDALLVNLSGWKAGVVAFADDALVFCPMTSDLAAVKTLTARLRPGMAELRQGSNQENALRSALAQLQGRSGAVLLVSDGEPLAGSLSKAAAEAQRAGVSVYVLGLGTPSGGKIPDGQDLFGEPVFRTQGDGSPAVSRADLGGLKEVARATGGLFMDASRPGAAERILAHLNSRWGAGSEGSEGVLLYQIPLAIALALLVLEAGLSNRLLLPFKARLILERVLRRVRRGAALALALLALSQTAWTWPWQGSPDARRGADAYAAGQWKEARAALVKAAQERPDDPKIAYDLGCAHYQAGDFEGAAKAFGRAAELLPRGDKTLAWVKYNQGNALYRLGEAKGERKARWTAAIAEYRSAIKANPKDADAVYNLELVTRRLKALPEEKQQGGASGQKQAPPKESGGGDVMPNQAEIQATLDALQHEELRFQGEVRREERPPEPSSASDLLKQLVDQAARGQPAERPDW